MSGTNRRPPRRPPRRPVRRYPARPVRRTASAIACCLAVAAAAAPAPGQQKPAADDPAKAFFARQPVVRVRIELATDQRDLEVESTVSLGEIAEVVAERARRRSGREIAVSFDGSQAVGRPQAIERAVNNLVVNALKFSDGPVEVSVQQGRIAVSDRGPGLGDIDRTKLFDRFYRSDAARALPGSGLGLAIVRETALQHGGTVFADDRPGGGATIGFTVPIDRVRNPTV